jgi:uncharacterized NAD(P)/FAD-binding protein YdhS
MAVDATATHPSRPTRVVVLGGGFSGAMSVVNIARLCDHPVEVVVIDRVEAAGRGVAYRRRRPEYLLNVAARNMSAFPDDPEHLLRWLRTHPEFGSLPEIELRERFIPRHIYGDYLSSIVDDQLRAASENAVVSSRFVIADAVDIEPGDDGCEVRLGDGSVLGADRVILATGNETPAGLPGAGELAGHSSWAGDPWQAWEQRLPEGDHGVVVLGTGLSAVDAIITLRALGWLGAIHAVSRHGWFPHAHFRGIEYPEFPPEGVDLADLGLDRLVALVRKHCAILFERGADPAIIVDKLRPHTQRIWAGLRPDERRTFAREHSARWNVFRHRIAPQLHALLTETQLTGQLTVHAAGIDALTARDGAVRVDLDDGSSLCGGLVINANGPASKLSSTQSDLLRNLLRRGLVTPDETDMGVRVDPDHTVLDGDGRRSPWLLALGPLLKGTYWETVAVPELRVQARRVAETVFDRVRAAEDTENEILLEYMI